MERLVTRHVSLFFACMYVIVEAICAFVVW